MKKLVLFIATLLTIATTIGAQNQNPETIQTLTQSPDSEVNYRIYKKSTNSFLKLDTRNGLLTLVEYNSFDGKVERPIITKPLTETDEAKPCRFFLYIVDDSPNTMLLLDQTDGRMWYIKYQMDNGVTISIIDPQNTNLEHFNINSTN